MAIPTCINDHGSRAGAGPDICLNLPAHRMPGSTLEEHAHATNDLHSVLRSAADLPGVPLWQDVQIMVYHEPALPGVWCHF